MKHAQINITGGTPSTPAAGLIKLFPDNSGVLKFVNPAGNVHVVGQVFESILSGNYPGQLGTFVTGLQPGITGSLGSTTTFFVIQGPSGAKYGLPAYVIS